MESTMAAGRALRGWGTKGNLPGFPGVLTVGGSLQTSTVPGQERPSSGQCHMWAGSQPEDCGVPGSSPRNAAFPGLSQHLIHMPHWTAFAAKTWSGSGMSLLRMRHPPQWPPGSSHRSVQSRCGSWSWQSCRTHPLFSEVTAELWGRISYGAALGIN